MRTETREQLLAINRAFYAELAEPFAQSRAAPQPGFAALLKHMPSTCRRVLDVGCGEGRFGRFVLQAHPDLAYVGVDNSDRLLAAAEASIPGATFFRRDVSRVGALQDLGHYGLVACLAVIQHIPGRDERVRLLRELCARLAPQGRLALSTWQFLDSERQRRKIVPWNSAGVDEAELEPHDYLISWRSGGYGVRYVSYIDPQEMSHLAADAGMTVVHSSRSDGQEGNLNLYTVLVRTADAGRPS